MIGACEFWTHEKMFSLRRVTPGEVRFFRAAALLQVLVCMCDEHAKVDAVLARPYTDTDYILRMMPTGVNDEALRQAFDDLVAAEMVSAAPRNPRVTVVVYHDLAGVSAAAVRMRRMRNGGKTRKKTGRAKRPRPRSSGA